MLDRETGVRRSVVLGDKATKTAGDQRHCAAAIDATCVDCIPSCEDSRPADTEAGKGIF
jgi:hypothetical protein